MNQIKSDNQHLKGAVAAHVSDGGGSKQFAELAELSKDHSRMDEFLQRAVVVAKSGDTEIVSDLVISTLADLRTIEEDDQFRNHCNFEVHSDKFAVFILEDRKTIVASNQLARERFDIKAATDASELDLRSLDGRPFTELVTEAIERRDPTSDVVPIAQAYSPGLKQRLDVAILHLHVCALMGITKEVILICDAITPATLRLFAEKFGLTPAEASIVQRFSAGQSIEEIATKRVRSLATVKTQFYKVLEKCGANSQSELLQMVARVESLNAATAGINEEFSHPHRRIFSVMRPGNRTLEIVSAGKPDGRPVVSCNSFVFRTFPAWLEEELYQNNLKLYSIAPPGSGKTTPPLEDQTLEDCFAQDIVSLLDNIGCDKTVLSGAGTNLPLCLEVAKIIPDRIQAVFANNAFAPANRLDALGETTGGIPIMRELTLGSSNDTGEDVSGGLFRFITRFGIERCTQMVLGQDRSSRDIMMRTDHLNGLKQAFAASIAQGVEFNVATFNASIVEDWEESLINCPVPVHLAIGEKDTLGPFSALEALARDHSEKVKFTKIDGANSLYPYTRHSAFFAALTSAVENP